MYELIKEEVKKKEQEQIKKIVDVEPMKTIDKEIGNERFKIQMILFQN
jgi:hypothetical protein